MTQHTDSKQSARWQLWYDMDLDHDMEMTHDVGQENEQEVTRLRNDLDPDFQASPHFLQHWPIRPKSGILLDVNNLQPPKIQSENQIKSQKNLDSVLKTYPSPAQIRKQNDLRSQILAASIQNNFVSKVLNPSPARKKQNKILCSQSLDASIKNNMVSPDEQWVIVYPDVSEIVSDKLASANSSHSTNLEDESDFEWPLSSSSEYETTCTMDYTKKKCEYCDEEFDNTRAALFHMKRMHKKFQQLICGICNKKCTSYATFRSHCKTHFADQGHLCEVCGKMFFLSVKLRLHQREQHQEESPYGCKFCQKRFKSKGSLKKHETNVHGSGLDCDFCSNHYKSKKRMIIHLLSKHIGKKSYDCDICGANFVYKYNRDSHRENNHTWACMICPTQFTMPKDAKAHCESAHTADELESFSPAYEKITKFRCDICFLCLATKQSLDKHKLTHKGVPLKTN